MIDFQKLSSTRTIGRLLGPLACFAAVAAIGLANPVVASEDDEHEGHEGDIYIGIHMGALYTGLIAGHDDHDDDHDGDDHDGDHDGDHDDDDHDGDHDDDHDGDDHDGDHDGDDHDGDHDGEYPEQRVFGADMGESGIPGFTSDPGWEAFPGTFDSDTWLGWNATHGLRMWSTDEFMDQWTYQLTMSYDELSFNVYDQSVSGMELATAVDGSFHLHTNFLITHENSDLAGVPVVGGIYLLELEMYAQGQDLESCESFWIVFNNGESEADHLLAIDWVKDNLALEEHCDADLDGDHDVDVEDLLAVIEDWGCTGDCVGDVNDSGTTEIEDLLEIISDFGGECH